MCVCLIFLEIRFEILKFEVVNIFGCFDSSNSLKKKNSYKHLRVFISYIKVIIIFYLKI